MSDPLYHDDPRPIAVVAAMNDPDDGIQTCVAEWQRRRDVLLEELRGIAERVQQALM